MASNLPNFTTQLDWAALNKPVNGDIYNNAMWTVNNVLPGMNLGIGDEGAVGASQGLRLAYNLGSIFYQGQWTLASSLPNNLKPYSFAGHFDAPPDTTPGSAVNPGNPGDMLIGLALNGAVSTPNLLLNFNAAGFDNIGFRVSSGQNADFSVRVQVFAGLSGTGALLSDSNYSYLGAGGQCSNLFMTVSNPPQPCNDAPFLALLNYQDQAHSISITTNDTQGFYIGSVYAGSDEISNPEPAAWILAGSGIALVILGRRRLKPLA